MRTFLFRSRLRWTSRWCATTTAVAALCVQTGCQQLQSSRRAAPQANNAAIADIAASSGISQPSGLFHAKGDRTPSADLTSPDSILLTSYAEPATAPRVDASTDHVPGPTERSAQARTTPTRTPPKRPTSNTLAGAVTANRSVATAPATQTQIPQTQATYHQAAQSKAASTTRAVAKTRPVSVEQEASPHGSVNVGAYTTGPHPAPRELAKVILPDYRIEPPDVLQIDAVHIAPKAPYYLRTFDSLIISVPAALPDSPIEGAYPIGPGGTINLGRPYGTVSVGGKTADEARAAIEKHLAEHLKDTQCSVALGEIGGNQQISGSHLVGPDGAITLGSYGKVSVVGMTIGQAKATIERHLSTSLDQPEISVDVFAYNSKTYYVILQGAGLGDGVNRFPVTGNDTVLDAISLISGLSPSSSTKIWVARPGRTSNGCHQLLPVDWYAITQCADATTNYQLMPGDRVYVAEDRLIALDTMLGKIIAPAERVLGFVALGTSTVSDLRFFHIPTGRGGF